jgi:radial spoke head protein 4A
LYRYAAAEFLRAQIARIASATVVCPSGFFALGEDGASLAKAEEFVAAPAEEMADLAKWGHRYAHIKAQGRCEFYAPPPPEGEEEAPPAEEPEVGPLYNLNPVDP